MQNVRSLLSPAFIAVIYHRPVMPSTLIKAPLHETFPLNYQIAGESIFYPENTVENNLQVIYNPHVKNMFNFSNLFKLKHNISISHILIIVHRIS